MLTPAMSASSTSAPPVIIENAVSTQVLRAAVLELVAVVRGDDDRLDALRRHHRRGLAERALEDRRPRGGTRRAAAAVVWTNSRRFSFFMAILASVTDHLVIWSLVLDHLRHALPFTRSRGRWRR